MTIKPGNFEKGIPDFIKELEQQAANLRNDQYKLVHECDCEYCDSDEVEDQDAYDALGETIIEVVKTIMRLIRHAEAFNMELPEKVLLRYKK